MQQMQQSNDPFNSLNSGFGGMNLNSQPNQMNNQFGGNNAFGGGIHLPNVNLGNPQVPTQMPGLVK